jgi:hypothetical protein
MRGSGLQTLCSMCNSCWLIRLQGQRSRRAAEHLCMSGQAPVYGVAGLQWQAAHLLHSLFAACSHRRRPADGGKLVVNHNAAGCVGSDKFKAHQWSGRSIPTSTITQAFHACRHHTAYQACRLHTAYQNFCLIESDQISYWSRPMVGIRRAAAGCDLSTHCGPARGRDIFFMYDFSSVWCHCSRT